VQRQELQRRLGSRIRELRLKRKWSQDVFADKSGFHRAQIGAFERGEMNLTLGSMQLLAQTLGVKIIDLLRGVEDRHAHQQVAIL
jgi:transcriptional regulator with XRE-family HTH domain